ncbi:acetylglutamate kinase [Bacillus carboniphilus]|uniref:Acetylglutamate kinase n=1 Tax=Bacillus carboniphilus TaxID=86663 RepID=A0ABY9JZ68_9BACI|nr:acetylglutamate kinase [Bacillus carboniphilus]WLR42931.1 acetylglutamate kinase [Bacillus carboniphilus]
MTMSKSMPLTERKQTAVIKLGGSMIDEISESFIKSIDHVQKYYDCLIVHGGGPHINAMLNKLNVTSSFHKGQRQTTAQVMEAVQLSLCGEVNPTLTALLNDHQIKALGLSGAGGALLTGEPIDEQTLGFVGEITEVNTDLLYKIMKMGYLPVVSPVARTKQGVKLNINADIAAAAIASALHAEKLIYITDVEGILREGKKLPVVTKEEAKEMIAKGEITGGMIPKVQSALSSLQKVKEVIISSGRQPLLQSDQFDGTTLVKEKGAIIN